MTQALYITDANALVSRMAQWAGVQGTNTGISVSAINQGTSYFPVLTTTSSSVGTVAVGDMVAFSPFGPYAYVQSVTSTAITLNDPGDVWSSAVALPTILYLLPSDKTQEFYGCIQLAELRMRVLELPALRTNPFDTTNPTILTVTGDGSTAPIPADMNWPILFFQDTASQASASVPNPLGPWIVYNRIGDRKIIERTLIDRIYVRPFNIPRVIMGEFSEVGPNYVFTPKPGAGTTIKAYYQRTFPFLFSTTTDLTNPLVMNNAALSSFPEGYLYASIEEYYIKNNDSTKAQVFRAKYDDAYGLIEDQNFKDKWRGGDRHLTSEFQPRQPRFTLR